MYVYKYIYVHIYIYIHLYIYVEWYRYIHAREHMDWYVYNTNRHGQRVLRRRRTEADSICLYMYIYVIIYIHLYIERWIDMYITRTETANAFVDDAGRRRTPSLSSCCRRSASRESVSSTPDRLCGSLHLSKDQQVTRTRTRQQNTRQQNKSPTRTQSEQRHNDA